MRAYYWSPPDCMCNHCCVHESAPRGVNASCRGSRFEPRFSTIFSCHPPTYNQSVYRLCRIVAAAIELVMEWLYDVQGKLATYEYMVLVVTVSSEDALTLTYSPHGSGAYNARHIKCSKVARLSSPDGKGSGVFPYSCLSA